VLVKEKRNKNGRGTGIHPPKPIMHTQRVHCIYIWCTTYACALIESSCPFFFCFFSLNSPAHMDQLGSFLYIERVFHNFYIAVLCICSKKQTKKMAAAQEDMHPKRAYIFGAQYMPARS